MGRDWHGCSPELPVHALPYASACCDPKKILTAIWVLLGELRCEWGLQERAAPLQIYYFSFSYKLGSEGKWNMLEQEEVTDGRYYKDSLITGFGEEVLHGDSFLIVAFSGKESQCS